VTTAAASAVNLNTNVGNINLTTAGNTFGTLTINGGALLAANSVQVTQNGSLTFAAITAGAGAVTLTSATGNIADAAGAVVAGNMTLKANDNRPVSVTDATFGTITHNDVGVGDTFNVADLTLSAKGTAADINIARGATSDFTGNLTVTGGRDYTSSLGSKIVAGSLTKTSTFTLGRNLVQTGAITGLVEVVTANDVTITNGANNLQLGNFGVLNATTGNWTQQVTGKLTVTTGGNSVSLVTDKALGIIGDTSITTAGGAIDLAVKVAGANGAETARGTIAAAGVKYNNFGGVTLNSGAGNITFNEGNTTRLLGLTSTGDVLVESFWGNIIQSGPTALTGAVTKTATFITTQGAITLERNDNEFRVVKAVTDLFGGAGGTPTNSVNGNVSLVTKSTSGNFVLAGGTRVGGTYSLVGDASLNGAVTDNGTLKIQGNVTLDVQSASITLADNVSTFGGMQFKAVNVDIYENAQAVIRGGSLATGTFKYSAFGAISFTSPLNCLFSNNVSLTTFGDGNTITIPNTFYMTGAGNTLQLTTNTGTAKLLSALSSAINLNGNTVVYINGAPTAGNTPNP
jgi:hypothetical protein